MKRDARLEEIGTLKAGVDVTVTLEEMSTWKPERIARFFAGIAKIISAVSGVSR